MADRPSPGNPFANMGALFGLQDPSGMPADTRMLETIIGEITGQKRGYLTQKIKHYESQLKRYCSASPSDNDVVLMQTLTELNSDLTMTAEDQWIGQPLNETVQGVLNCLDMEFLPEVMSRFPSSPSHGLDLSHQHPGSLPRVVSLHRRERRPGALGTQTHEQ